MKFCGLTIRDRDAGLFRLDGSTKRKWQHKGQPAGVFLTMTKVRDELGEVGDLSKICIDRVWFSKLSAMQALQMDAPQRERMLKRELFPTLGMPTTPTCKLLLGRPSMAFFSATTSAGAHCQHGACCRFDERQRARARKAAVLHPLARPAPPLRGSRPCRVWDGTHSWAAWLDYDGGLRKWSAKARTRTGGRRREW